MIILDRLLVGGIKFVLGKVAVAVEQELNDDTALREQLLAAQMQVELGEMTEDEFAQLESEVLTAIREIRERREGGPRAALEFGAPSAAQPHDASAPEDDGRARYSVEAEFMGEHMGGDADEA